MERTFGRFHLGDELGRGGMGVVVKAEDPDLRRTVALKLLAEDALADPIARARFLREARAGAALQHPGIVPIHEVGEVEGRPFLSMDWVEGEDLERAVAGGPLPARRAAEILRDVARALQHAHDHGIVHRDLKPGNILLERSGRVLVSDFGLARHVGAETTRLSVSGEILGTPAYMSPEQARGANAEIGPPSDVYALGALLYHLVTARPPFSGDSVLEILLQVQELDPPAPRRLNPRVHRDLETICRVAMDKEPARRYRTAAAFADDCERFLAGEPIRARTRGVWSRAARRLTRRRDLALAAAVAAIAVVASALVLVPRLRERAARLERQQQIHALTTAVRAARPFFYVPGSDIDAKLRDVRAALLELQRLADEPAGAGDADLWAALGTGRYFVGDTDRAEEALVRAEKLGSADGTVAFHLGRIFLERSVLARLREPSESLATVRARSKELSERAAGFLLRPGPAAGASAEIDRCVAEAYRVWASGTTAALVRRCEEGLKRFGTASGSEEFWNLLAIAVDGDQRISACTRALAIRPHYPWISLVRGLAREQAGELAEARADFDSALRVNPDMVEAWLGRALVRRKQKDTAGAIADTNQALRVRPGHARAWKNRGLARLELGDAAGACADLDEAVRLKPEDATTWSDRALARRKLGDLPGAIADCDQAIRVDPEFAEPRSARALCRAATGDVAGALADYDQALQLEPKLAHVYANRAQLWVGQKDLARALADLDRAVSLEPGVAVFRVSRGAVRCRRGDFAGARADLDEAIRREPGSALAFHNRGTARLALGDAAGARADYEEAIRLDPACADAWFGRAYLRAANGDPAGALADYSTAIRLDPHNAEAWYNRGSARADQGDATGALEDFGAALAENPRHVNALLARAGIRLERKDLDGALADCEAAVQADPRSPDALARRGDVRAWLGDPAGQMADYERALRVAPPGWATTPVIKAALAKLKAGK